MMTKQRNFLFFLFFVSGFSGLIYESIWTHYLKLFLGHAAYAQTLVLMIFMGGMALGSWFCSHMSLRWRNLLLGYALVEGLIGVAALFFHPVFRLVTDYSFDHIIPALGSPMLVYSFKWGLAGLLVLPQSVLLGMTFPLMSGGVVRRFTVKRGSSISMLYFTNSLGGALGVLASGFLTIKWLGLNGTIVMAGAINVLLAVIVWSYFRQSPEAEQIAPDQTRQDSVGSGFSLMLVIAMLTGLASFVYEISWIRMLSLVLGSSTHAFELMLSAFVFGLACGGFWIHKRIDSLSNTVRSLAIVQIIMGIAALLTLPLYSQTFNLMQWLLSFLSHDGLGYFAFNLASHAIAMSVMFPAAFCAGMTLPLITYNLIDSGYGERAIGAVYGVNTLGAIIGTVLTVHLGFSLLGLKGTVIAGATIDICLGIYLCWRNWETLHYWMKATLLPAGVVAILFVFFFVELNPHKMASGVYRKGELLQQDSRVLIHRDGKTATISVTTANQDTKYSIRTNGKVDAAVNMIKDGTPTTDEVTMTLTAAIPSLLRPGASTVANIGFGSGMTSHVLLENPNLDQLDTIEIEPAIVDAARLMAPFNSHVYQDPRSRIHFEDAKTFFSASQNKYDLIISEPSNPWVSGVAGLFSAEFYHNTKRHLAERGVLAQWLQVYEFDFDLLSSIIKSISSEFENFSVYGLGRGDLLLLASDSPIGEFSAEESFAIPELVPAMERIGVAYPEDLRLRWLGDREFLMPLIQQSAVPANSDFFPYVDQHAGKARFLKANAYGIHFSAIDLLPIRKILAGRDVSEGRTRLTITALNPSSAYAGKATYLFSKIDNDETPSTSFPVDMQILKQYDQLWLDCRNLPANGAKTPAMFQIAVRVLPYLSTDELEMVWQSMESMACGADLDNYESLWLNLYKAIGRRSTGDMQRISRQLMDSPQLIDTTRAQYLLGIGMLSLLAEDKNGEALDFWETYAPKWTGDDVGVPFRYLLAVADYGINNT